MSNASIPYNNWILQQDGASSFGKACSILVGNKILSLFNIIEHMTCSEVVRQLLAGNALYAASSPFALAAALLDEMSIPKESLFSLYGTPYLTSPVGEWIVKTELDAASMLGKNIQEIREIVSVEELHGLYDLYHVYYDSNVIIAEQYLPKIQAVHQQELEQIK